MLATLFLLASTALAAAPAGAQTFDVGEGSAIHFTITHKFHEVEGVSHAVEGKVLLLGDHSVRAMVRAPSASFDTGNANRDAHMKEAIDAQRFPLVELKGLGRNVQLPAAAGATTQAPLQVQVTFHGVQKQFSTPVTVTRLENGSYAADAKLQLSLDSFGVERPSLLFVKIDDACPITAHLVLVPER